jgi:hypothetical protein
MKSFRTSTLLPLRPVMTGAALLLLAGALAVSGCGKKVTTADASYTTPEGTFSPDARLVVYPDAPVLARIYSDGGEPGPGVDLERPDLLDTLRDSVEVRQSTPGTLHGIVFDGTPASAYQVLRRESNGGLFPLKDYLLPPNRRFLDSQWELYAFQDPTPSGYSPASYIGRGLVSGAVSRTSPLTNLGVTIGSDVSNLAYTGDRAPTDTLITMRWVPVPEAVGYWIQVYQFRGNAEERLLSATPAPFVLGPTRDFFVAWVPAPADSYKIGRPGAMVLTRRVLLSGAEYFVRVSAVSAEGRLVAFTYGDLDEVRGRGTYRLFRLGAARVAPHRLGS